MPRKKAEKVVSEEQEEFEADEPSEVEELANNATDDDWTPADDEKKGSGRPQRASRARKPMKLTDGGSSDEDNDDDDSPSFGGGRGTKRKRGGGTAVRGGRGRGRGGGGAAASPAAKKAKAAPPASGTDENGKGAKAGGKKKSSTAAAADGEGEEDEMDDVEDEMDDDEESVSDEDDSDEDSTAEDDSEIPEQFKSGRFVVLKSDFDNKEENYPLWKIDGKSLLQKFDKFMHNNEELYKGTTIYAGWSKAIISTYYPINVEYKTLDNGESSVKFDPSQITPEMQKAKSTEGSDSKDGVAKEEPKDGAKEDKDEADGKEAKEEKAEAKEEEEEGDDDEE